MSKFTTTILKALIFGLFGTLSARGSGCNSPATEKRVSREGQGHVRARAPLHGKWDENGKWATESACTISPCIKLEDSDTDRKTLHYQLFLAPQGAGAAQGTGIECHEPPQATSKPANDAMCNSEDEECESLNGRD